MVEEINPDALYKPRSCNSQVTKGPVRVEEESKNDRASPNPTEKPVNKTRNRTLKIALVGMLAGVYAALTVVLGSISFLQFNFRLANILIGVVPIIGWPAVFGISLGVFLGNIFSPLGPIDLLSSLFSLVGLIAIQLLKKKSVLAGLIVYSLILSFWVNYELSLVFHSPYFPMFYLTSTGITLVVVVLGYIVYRSLEASGLRKRIENTIGE